MAYRLTVYFRGMPKARAELMALKRYINGDAGSDITRGAFNAAGAVFEQNFQSEGKMVGGWPALRERTQKEREALGFDPQHPILIRYGDLKYAVATTLMNATGSTTFTATDPQGKSISMSLNISKRGGTATPGGVKSLNQGRRPYWFTTQPVTRAIRKEAAQVLAHEIEGLY